MNEKGAKNSEKVGLFQIVVLILSIVVLAALGADTAFKLPKEISDILQTLDTLVCVILLIDFVVRFYKAEFLRQVQRPFQLLLQRIENFAA